MSLYFLNQLHLEAVVDSHILPAFGGLCLVSIPLACAFCYYMIFYPEAFVMNLPAHVTSPFKHFTIYTFRAIRYNYSTFLGSGIVVGMLFMFGYYNKYVTVLFLIVGFIIFCNTFAYPLILSIISIQRFKNNGRSEQFLFKWTEDKVVGLMLGIGFLVIVKELALWVWLGIVFFDYVPEQAYYFQRLNTVFVVHSAIYTGQQIILVIAMIVEHNIRTLPIGHAECLVAKQTKYLGIVKLPFLVVFVICWFVNFNLHPFVVYCVFFGIDFFLIPVIIEVTEVNSKPNIVGPIATQMYPTGAWP